MKQNRRGSNTPPKFYECPECHLFYRSKEWAKRCAAWCRVHHSCNLEITAHAEKSSKNEIIHSNEFM